MSSLKLGDASIRVTLDPSVAKQQAEQLRRELERIEVAKKKVQEEMERTARGEAPPTGSRQDPNNPGGSRTAQTPNQSLTPGKPESGGGGSGGLKGKIQEALFYTRIAATSVKGTSAFSDNVRAAFAGTPLEGLVNKAAEAVKEGAEKVITGEAYLGAVPDTITDVVDYNIASLKLGGRFPEDEDQILKEFFLINAKQAELRKGIDLEMQANMWRTLPKAITEAARYSMNR